MTIKEHDFRKIDLNLLIAFTVLFREQSVSLAADKLHLGQPAVSGALARLREMFDDPLFIRSGHRMQPTARACELHRELMPLLEQLQSTLFQPTEFSPSAASTSVTLGMSDWLEMCLMPTLLPALKQLAPGLHVHVVTSTPVTDMQQLEGGELDMAISVARHSARWLERKHLTEMPHQVIWHPQQISLEAPLTMDDYIAASHIQLSNREATSSLLDRALAKQGKSRHIDYTTAHFAALPGLLQQMPLMATVPAGLARQWQRGFAFCRSPLPLGLAPLEVSLLWHQRHNSDTTLMWLADTIEQQLIKQIEDGVTVPQ
ncbi:LysR family transcriptional regulator [Citrobacter sp. JGM124]|uniref:LysR family transcriptional regulator n=1 Tax=Citrobacter sp. JGM124 TaxID=2799789 RepID=UPI001BAAB35A|nr:LysR family transcriptional regulator [Citrobacter sp. JGM124]MBS0847717.1 LysR family transcriptional regulator [Citrobacter sp. JGM124]